MHGEKNNTATQTESLQPILHGSEADFGVSLDQVERVAEGVMATSLFERHGDTVVNIKGVTGPLRALAALCPRDLSEEPPEKVHNWTVDVLTEAGYELTDEDKAFTPPPDEIQSRQNSQKKT